MTDDTRARLTWLLGLALVLVTAALVAYLAALLITG